jgi:hypothetical protein
MQINLLPESTGQVVAVGSYFGGPDYEFVVGDNFQIYFQVVGHPERVWAGPDLVSFRKAVALWKEFCLDVEHIDLGTETRQKFQRVLDDLRSLGALPNGLRPRRNEIWSLLLEEAACEIGCDDLLGPLGS